MGTMQPLRTWLLVAQSTMHLDILRDGEDSWWCVDRKCKPGERAFIYRTAIGIILQLEILEILHRPEAACTSYGMMPARVKILNVFQPPITSKDLKSSVVRDEGFVRRNFQGKSFVFTSQESPGAILALAQKMSEAKKPS